MRFDCSEALLLRDAMIERVNRALCTLSAHPDVAAYGIVIVGSWATQEPHLFVSTEGSSVCTSYSDLDLVHKEPIPQSKREGLLNMFRIVSKSVGVDKVSLRSIAEYEALPHGAVWISAPTRCIDVDISLFLRFWYLVSCTEAIILQRRTSYSDMAVQYSLAKILYSLLRNIALISGFCPKSYGEINELFHGLVDQSLLASAYFVKLGTGADDHNLMENFFRVDIKSFMRHLQFSISSEVSEMVSYLSGLLVRGALSVDEVVAMLTDCAYSKGMRDVIDYQIRKLQK